MKPNILSMVQPTNRLHIGNYLGALRSWIHLQKEHPGKCFFAVASLHALTVTPLPEELRQARLITAKTVLATGVDPDLCTLFDQADAASLHTELGWFYTCHAPFGHLARMTQFKAKAEGRDSAGAGLLCYPLLMAADIALYGPLGGEVLVPVGEDQVQHVEVCRDWTARINAATGLSLPMAKTVLSSAPRVMSLLSPTKKMSKSEPSGCIFLLDSDEEIAQKIRRATTDSGEHTGPGTDNLLVLLGACGGEAEEQDFRQAMMAGAQVRYGDLKAALTEHIVEVVRPIRERYLGLTDEAVAQALRLGAEQALAVASQKMSLVREGLGLR